MKTQKTGILFLALLVALATLVSVVSAGNAHVGVQAVNSGSSASSEISYTREVSATFPLIDQGDKEWCQVATAWMIGKYYYPDNTRTLEDIAATMKIPNGSDGKPDPTKGAKASDEIAYYRSDYSNGAKIGGLGMQVTTGSLNDKPLTVTTIKYEINNKHPIKVGYNGHSRVLIGYRVYKDGSIEYEFANSQLGGYTQWEKAPNPTDEKTGYQDYIIAEKKPSSSC